MKYTLDLLPLRAFQGRGTPVGGRGLRLHGGSDMGNYFYETDNSQQAAADAAYQQAQAPQAPAADINSLYQELLGRAPDPTGIAANAGASADTIRESILASPEYNNQNINTIYQDLLGRAPDPTGIAANAGATPEQIRQSIFGSAEYQNQSPPSGFFDMPGYGAENADPYSIVGNMLMQGNQLVYNVAPIRDDSGNISGYNRADTGEYVDLNKLNKSITGYDKEITDLYENLLGRAPDVSEVIAYNNQLKSGEVNLGDVYQGFMQSPERLSRVMPFLDPSADVNTKFEQGVAGFDAKGLSREGYLEGLPTHYVDPKTGKLAAWFGTLGDSMQTDDYTWHTVDELRAIPNAKVYLAQESQRDVGKDWRTLGTKAAGIIASMAAPQLMAYLAPTLTTGSALADAALQSAVMQGGKTALSGGDISDILRSAGTGAALSAAGSVAGDVIGDYFSSGLSDVEANALMGDYTSSPTFNDYVDYRSAGDSGDMGDSGESAEYIEPAANKARLAAELESVPDQFYDAQPIPTQPEQLPDLTIPTAENYDMPEVDLTAGVPEQNLADQIITNPDVPISDVLSNLNIISLLRSGTSVEGVAEIIGAIGGAGSGGGGGIGGGGVGGGVGGGIAGIINDIFGSAEDATEDEETKKKKKQQQSAALAAIEAIAARTPPGAQIDYLYDIGGKSIFAPMRQQRPRQDWAYEPNDRFAQGGMVAFDEGGLASLDVPEKKGVLARMVEPETKVVEALAAYGSNPEKYENIYSFYTNPNRPVVDKDRKELPSGLSEMSKDYSGLDMAVLGMLHSAKQSGNPERFLESLAPYFDQKVKFDFSDRRGPSGYVLPIVAPNTANIAQKGVQANSPSFAIPTSNVFFHELEHTLQNKDRGYPSAVANALTNDALLGRMDKDILKRAKEYRFTNPTMDKARAFPAENAFDNPSETLANIAAAAQGMAMQGKDYLQTEEGQALFPTDADKNYFYNATLPGVTSMRQDMGFFEPKSESRLKKDESIAQTVARKLGFAQGGLIDLLRSK
jgi:hypothetical protein